ncbi:MAG: hypothetical protein WBH44_07620 [Proteocatella sp.]
MFPRLLFLFALIIISFKIFHLIYIKTFKLELCNDDFYTGGIKSNSLRSPMNRRKIHDSRRSGTIRPAITYESTKQLKGNMSYSSYESYKKVNF